MKLFIDTWGWIVLYNKKEPRHQEVTNLYKNFRYHNGLTYTTDYVLDETFTLLFRKTPFHNASESLKRIEDAAHTGFLKILRITPERFEKTKLLRLKFQDKPKISFTDLTSMVVMKELEITDILTEDAHFIQTGMKFQILP